MDAEAWDERYRGKELVWSAGPNRFVAEELADLPPGRAVDLAAGEGRNAVWLAEQGWDVDAVDFSAVALRKAEEMARERGVAIRTVSADVTEAGSVLAQAPLFDLALIVYLHLPWPRMEEALRLAATSVRPGGTLLLVGHHADNIGRGHGGPQDPDVLYTAGQVADAWRSYARIVKAEAVDRPVETEEGPRTAIDALVRAERM